MTAKEYFNKALGGNLHIATLKVVVFEEIMQDFARFKCKEQREICYDETIDMYDRKDVLNAPEPEM